MDWITVKIKAGNIVPALATTTAAIAGLQTIELLKFLKDLPIEGHRNSFLNLAVPSLMMGEPGPPQKFKITDSLEFNLWDRWEYKATSSNVSLTDLLDYLTNYIHKNQLNFRDIFHGSTPVFLSSLAMIQNPGLKSIKDSPILKQPILELLSIKPEDKPDFIELTITFILKVQAEGE